MPLVQIHILEGRTAEQKKNLISNVAEAVSRSVDAPMESIRIQINEMKPDQWAIGSQSIADRRKQQ